MTILSLGTTSRAILTHILLGLASAALRGSPPARVAKELNASSRVFNGYPTARGAYPYFVQGEGCGGSLVAPDVVLTAAHCNGAFVKSVIVGSNEYEFVSRGAESRFVLSEMVVHPKYDSGSMEHDFGLFKIEAVTNPNLIPVLLNEDSKNPEDDQMLTVVGFGMTSMDDYSYGGMSEVLMEGQVPAMSAEQCDALLHEYAGVDVVDEATMFCAGDELGGVDSCYGDSGGPLLDEYGVQVGVVSWGIGYVFCESDNVTKAALRFREK
jgi:trypsin